MSSQLTLYKDIYKVKDLKTTVQDVKKGSEKIFQTFISRYELWIIAEGAFGIVIHFTK